MPSVAPTAYPSILIIPPQLSIGATKPDIGRTSLYLVNLEKTDQNWKLKVINGSAPSANLTYEITPENGTASALTSQTVEIDVHTLGAVAGGGECESELCTSSGDFLLYLEITSQVKTATGEDVDGDQGVRVNVIPLVVSIATRADPDRTEYTIVETATSPQLGKNWPRAVQIIPRDLDGFRVFEDTGEIFQVELGLTESSQLPRECPTRNMSSATAAVEVGVCTTSWIDKPVVSSTNLSDADALYSEAESLYSVDCDVYLSDDQSGSWDLRISHATSEDPDQKEVFLSTFVPKCPQYFYMSGADQCHECVECVDGSACAQSHTLIVGESIGLLELESGYWRSTNVSQTVYPCKYEGACINRSSTLFGEELCNSGYRGPVCGTCAAGHFFSWNSHGCIECAAPEAHKRTVQLWGWMLLITLGVAVVLAIVYAVIATSGDEVANAWLNRIAEALNSDRLRISIPTKICKFARAIPPRRYRPLPDSRRPALADIVLITYQTIYQFTDVSSTADSESEYPEPAQSFIDNLSFTFLDLSIYIPPSCIYPNADFYDKLLGTTVFPFMIVIAIIFIFVLQVIGMKISSSDSVGGVRKRWMSHLNVIIVLLYLILPSVTTVILNTFQCETIDGESSLSAQLTLTCDGRSSDRRRKWEIYAYLMLTLYPFAVPALCLVLCFVYRKRISPKVDKRGKKLKNIKEQLKARDEDEKLDPIRFLFELYKPDSWWFGIFTLGMRLTQTCALVFLGSSQRPFSSSVAAVVTSIVFMIVQRETNPYLTPADNVLGYVGTWVVFLWL